MKSFQGLFYYKNSSEGKLVDINIEDDIIKIYLAESSYLLPIGDSEFKLGGESDSFLVIVYQDMALYIKDHQVFDELLLKSDKKSAMINELKNKHSNRKKHAKLTPLYLFATFILVISIIYGGLYVTTYVISHSFPLSWEKKIGDIATPQIVGTKKITDESVVKAIESIGKQLESASGNHDYEFKYYVVKDEEVNAFALPGGHVIVNTGLIKKSESYEEVAGVISHELQHVYQRHGIEKIVNQIGISFTLMMIFGDFSGVVNTIGGELLGLKFSREEESEADALGLDLMYKAKINPEGMISFFRKLEELNKEASNLPDFISSHPNTKQRIKDLESLVKRKYPAISNKKEFSFNWKEIKEKVNND